MSNPIHVGWVGLNFFKPTIVGWVEKPSQPDPCTPLPFGICFGE